MTTVMIDPMERTPSLPALVPGWTVMKQQIVPLPVTAIEGMTVHWASATAIHFREPAILILDGLEPRAIRADYPVTYGPITRDEHERWTR